MNFDKKHLQCRGTMHLYQKCKFVGHKEARCARNILRLLLSQLRSHILDFYTLFSQLIWKKILLITVKSYDKNEINWFWNLEIHWIVVESLFTQSPNICFHMILYVLQKAKSLLGTVENILEHLDKMLFCNIIRNRRLKM